ncbi:MAG: family 43 glycosylhydrolase, partial [Rhodospirillaceae bacterium]|nr:family 43 glycosylhydrolase [Rhodospirillaceae bacterium]
MTPVRNPILPGFNPDPSICRAGDDYYIATSTFEWYQGTLFRAAVSQRGSAMSKPSLPVSSFAVCLLLGILLSGCGGSGSSGGAQSPSPPPVSGTPPPPAPPTEPINVNIDNPTLTVELNEPITPGGTMTLVWSDEFDGERLDPQRWFFEAGDGGQYSLAGWGNDEHQWYLTDSALLENGLLVITARRESQNGYDYTSARLHTRGRFAFRYGRIEARIRLPGGQGLWPAFWLLPQEDT